MRVLNLFKERRHSSVKLSDGVDYKIPNEYTVEEVERLLELSAEQEALEKEPASENEVQKQEQIKKLYSLVFDQLEIIVQHHQPEITAEYLKSVMTGDEALEMMGFFQKYRHANIMKGHEETSKKKVN